MDYRKKLPNSFQIHKKKLLTICSFFLPIWSTLLLFEKNILDILKVEIVIESNFWLGMYVLYNLKWSLYPKIDENQCLSFIVNFEETNIATISKFSHIIHNYFASI